MEIHNLKRLRRLAAIVLWSTAALSAPAVGIGAETESASPPAPPTFFDQTSAAITSAAIEGDLVDDGLGGGYLDLDQYVETNAPCCPNPGNAYYWQVLPDSLIYKSYLAGAKESRMSGKIISMRDQGALWDATLGARIGLFRYGTGHRVRPEGIQLDIEGSAQVRLDIEEEVDVQSVDFRGGIPLTFGRGPFQTKLAYYHLSSHLGDEFVIKNPNFNRLNFSRDVVVLGQSIYITNNLRVYGEMGYSFYTFVTQPWEFQFGLDYAPACATGPAGAPFFAFNGHLREEVNFGGNLTFQAGWAWRGDENARLLRIGLHYYNGESSQYSFFDFFEEQIGIAAWYDF